MALKKYKPTSPGKRHRKTLLNTDISKEGPEKSLLKRISKKAGRNNNGRITVRHKGGGAKRRYREIDFKRDKEQKCKVIRIEYDPYRNARICLVQYKDGEKRYVLQPKSIKVGDEIESGSNSDARVGNSLSLKEIPAGMQIHNIELVPGNGGQLCRSAGTGATLMAKHNDYVTIKMPSGEVRMIHHLCKATIGQVGNEGVQNIVIGKAGAKRWKGVRPTVRGSVMNAADHPHGGGEGRAPIGRSGPSTVYGKKATVKTRNKKKKSGKWIVKSRSRR